MAEDPMKTAADVFAVLEKYDDPEGWAVLTQSGWPRLPYGSDEEPTSGPGKGQAEAGVKWDGQTFPRRFHLAVMHIAEVVKESSDHLTAEEMRFTTLLMSFNDDHVVTFAGAVTVGEDLDRRLAQLLKLRTLEWWKVKALIDLKQFAPTPALALDGDADSYLSLLRRIVAPASTSQTRRNNRITRSLLIEVADTYRAALDEGKPPTVAVERHFTISRPNAAKWVARARAEKLLGPAIGPTGGEGPVDG